MQTHRFKKSISTFLLCLFAHLSYGQNYNYGVSITDFGAKGDSVTINTKEIQAAIDHVLSKGGGTVLIPSGTFLTGTLILGSNVHVYFTPGAIIRGSSELGDYARYQNGNQMGIFFAQDQSNITISGEGIIDGNGRSFIYPNRVKDLPLDLKSFTRQKSAYLDTTKGIQDGPVVPFEHKRPYQTLLFSGVKNLNITNITIIDAPFWAVHVADSDHIQVRGVRIRNSLLMPNSDGLNFTSSSNIIISDCDIIAGDDALAFSGYSSHYELPGYRQLAKNSENVTVTNCLLKSRSSAIRIGGLDQNSLKNYSFSNITIYDSNRGIGLFVHQDGNIENIQFSNIQIQTRLHTGDWWGNGEPIHISVIKGAPLKGQLGSLKNVSFSNIYATSEAGILVYSDQENQIEQLRFTNVYVTIVNGQLQDEYGGNFDLRPAFELQKNIFEHDVPGIYLKNVNKIELDRLSIRWGEQMHTNFKYGLMAENVKGIRAHHLSINAPRSNELAYLLNNSDPINNED